MQFDFIGMQAMYLSLARADAGPLAKALQRQAADRHRLPVGHLRAQPRRAHPRQAQRLRASGGLRRLRPGRVDAAVRTGTATPPPTDARRRPAACPHGLQPAVLAARHPGPLLRRGDRDGREPRGRRPSGGADADAVERREERRLLRGGALPPPVTRGRGRVRARVRQRRGPAPRPGLAAEVRLPAGTALPRVPRARVGRVHGAGAAARRRARAPVHLGSTRRWSRCTTSATRRAPCR